MIARIRGDKPSKASVLEQLARKVEPTDAQLKEADQLPERSRVARMIKQATAIPDLHGKLRAKTHGPAPPVSTSTAIMTLDREPMVFMTDGSWRHAGGRVKGKALRKALKRARRRVPPASAVDSKEGSES